jgi:hypothetical protein
MIRITKADVLALLYQKTIENKHFNVHKWSLDDAKVLEEVAAFLRDEIAHICPQCGGFGWFDDCPCTNCGTTGKVEIEDEISTGKERAAISELTHLLR